MNKRWLWAAGLLSAALPLALAAACSGDESNASGSNGAGASGAQGGSGGSGGELFPDGGMCTPGQACEGGGVCTNDGSCCPEEQFCGGSCCVTTDVCSFQSCVTPGNECVDATDCAPGEYCEYSLGDNNMGSGGGGGGCQGGTQLRTGKCLPKPPECGPNEDPGDPPTCLTKCEYRPPVSAFDPQLKFSWGDVNSSNHDVMMAPVVTQLDDDNCDGNIDQRDIPDIVFFTFAGSDYNNNNGNSATLRAISIVDGQVVTKWNTATGADEPGRSIASGDIHPSPGNEIVVCTNSGAVRAYDASGNALWLSAAASGGCFMPSIADVDQDGQAEIVVRGHIIDGSTGATEQTLTPANTDNVVVTDVTGNGQLDIVTPTRVYDANGTQLVDVGVPGTHPAVGDLDNDGIPEIVTVDFLTHSLSVWHLDPNQSNGYEIIRQGVDINGNNTNICCQQNPNSSGCTRGGGPPTIADFNGDGFPDVGMAGGIGYVMFDGVKLMDTVNYTDVNTIAWIKQTQDCSSAQTGSSVFDFDGDGQAEVVYADEVTLHVYDGLTGNDLFSTCNTSGTLWEYPLVADVDSDGHADIVVASNRYSGLSCSGAKTTGIRVFGDTQGKWVRTRRIWNQHPYHVTNVNEDGTIPQIEQTNYTTPGLNNFRQNVQPLGEFAAPDLVVEVFPICAGEYALVARVRNIGEASVPAGVLVGFYEGDPMAGGTLLGEAMTTQPLYSLQSEDVRLVPTAIPSGLLYAVVDHGMPMHTWHECRDDNNTSEATDPGCGPN